MATTKEMFELRIKETCAELRPVGDCCPETPNDTIRPVM